MALQHYKIVKCFITQHITQFFCINLVNEYMRPNISLPWKCIFSHILKYNQLPSPSRKKVSFHFLSLYSLTHFLCIWSLNSQLTLNQLPSLTCSLYQILLVTFLLWQATTHTVKFIRKPSFPLIKKMYSYSCSKAFPLDISRNRKMKKVIKFIQGLQQSEKT